MSVVLRRNRESILTIDTEDAILSLFEPFSNLDSQESFLGSEPQERYKVALWVNMVIFPAVSLILRSVQQNIFHFLCLEQCFAKGLSGSNVTVVLNPEGNRGILVRNCNSRLSHSERSALIYLLADANTTYLFAPDISLCSNSVFIESITCGISDSLFPRRCF